MSRLIFHPRTDLSFPAHVAAFNNDLDHLRMLVENGVVNINERDDKGSTLAHKGKTKDPLWHIKVRQWIHSFTRRQNKGVHSSTKLRQFFKFCTWI